MTFLESLLQPFQFESMRHALVISMLVAVPAALLSCFLVLKGWSLMGDAISHAVFPGVAIALHCRFSYAVGAFAAGTREGRIKYGYVFNVEQAITSDVGVFGRWSWNDGKTEIMAFTDIDASLSFGTSIKGTSWGRPDDTIGIGGAFNTLSRDHRDFIAAGGIGVLIGDGQLNYRQERIFETYYAVAVTKQITATADYQFIANPAYNSDRGPVSVFSGRLRGEF